MKRLAIAVSLVFASSIQARDFLETYRLAGPVCWNDWMASGLLCPIEKSEKLRQHCLSSLLTCPNQLVSPVETNKQTDIAGQHRTQQ